jgi:hypothetical protein
MASGESVASPADVEAARCDVVRTAAWRRCTAVWRLRRPWRSGCNHDLARVRDRAAVLDRPAAARAARAGVRETGYLTSPKRLEGGRWRDTIQR